ncbi:hypothetical protein [Streptomyces sp. YKOK-I1]
MFPWIMWSVILLAPFVIGGTLAVRTARRANKADRAMRVLAGRPGWSRVERGPDGEQWAMFAGHFPWLLRTVPGSGATGPLGSHEVTVARRWEPVGRRDMRHWLIVYFDGSGGPDLRLERHWSAAEIALSFAKDLPYQPMSTDYEGTVQRFYGSDLPQRLVRFAAPAVSVREDGVCFLYPMPDVVDMGTLLEELAALLPDLAALARA